MKQIVMLQGMGNKKHGIRPNIVGRSPYLESIKHFAPADTVFQGMLNGMAKINEIFPPEAVGPR
jgi:hypothetical protein